MSKPSETTLAEAVHQAEQYVTAGAIYHHYTDKALRYKVLALGIQESTHTVCIIYQALYGEKLVWTRDLDDWLSYVVTPAGRLPRFAKESE